MVTPRFKSVLVLAKSPAQPKRKRFIFEKLNAKPKRFVREFRISGEELGKFQEGQEIKLSDVFAVGQKVDVSRAKPKVVVSQALWPAGTCLVSTRGHGTHEFFRHGGSIGCRAWPGTVMKGKKMGGHYGDEKVTTQNLTIVTNR
jgi:large subunit ribosomal protein L3